MPSGRFADDTCPIALPGGEFPLGDAFDEGYLEDAEGSVRRASVEPLRLYALANCAWEGGWFVH
ncbi:hypothetical protein OG223_11305 [Streptomyces sp. NBC_01478]|uniref:hypothetical protein n=1 Tax=Streptomyces sp. NBC_01478 TaxID=2903882 RepID=UPI002E32C931|nr:hypothetical protein [Streptomyces sp. NBC_01478]